MRNPVSKTMGILVLAGLCALGPAATAWPAGMGQAKAEYSATQRCRCCSSWARTS